MTSSRREILEALGKFQPVLDPKPNVCRVFVLSNSGNRFEGYLHPPFPSECVDGEALGVDTITLSDAFCHGPEGRPCRFPATPGPVVSSDLRMRTSTILIHFVDTPSIAARGDIAYATRPLSGQKRSEEQGHEDPPNDFESTSPLTETCSHASAAVDSNTQSQPAFDQLHAARDFHSAQRRTRSGREPSNGAAESALGSACSGASSVTEELPYPTRISSSLRSPWVRSPGALSATATVSTALPRTGYEQAFAAVAGGYTLIGDPELALTPMEGSLSRGAGSLASGIPASAENHHSAPCSEAPSSFNGASMGGVLDSTGGIGGGLPTMVSTGELEPSTLPADMVMDPQNSRSLRAARRACKDN